MTSSSAGDGVVFVPRHPRFNPHQLPAGAAGPFKAVRARRTIPKADVPPPADDATPEDSKAIPTDVSAAASNATPVVSQVLFGDGKTLLAPNEACMNAWEAIPNRGTKLIDEKATTPTPATIKASSGSVSNVLYSSGPLTTSRNGTLVPSSGDEDVSDVSTRNFKALARLGHRIQSSPGETNKDVSNAPNSQDSLTTPKNKPSALPHHCAQPSKAGPLVHSNTVHRGSPVPPAYATSLNHGNLGVDDTDSRYVFSWHMTSIINTGLQYLSTFGTTALTDYLFGMAFQDCRMAEIVSFSAHNIVQQARTWGCRITPDPARELRTQILRLHNDHWCKNNGWMGKILTPAQEVHVAIKSVYVGGLIGSLFAARMLTPEDVHSSIQLILSKRPTFNGLCAIHALITHSDSRLCAPEYGLVIASYKAALTGVLRWARDATGYDLVREISGRLDEWKATQELDTIRARVNPAEAQSGDRTLCHGHNMFANKAGTRVDRNQLRENSPIYVGPSRGRGCAVEI